MQKGMKLTLILLGLVVLLVIVCGGILSLALSPVMRDNLKLGAEAGAKSEEYMRAISAKWEPNELLDRSTLALKAAVDHKRLEAWFKDCNTRYGAYKGAKIHPSSIDAMGSREVAKQAVVELTMDATFERGTGRIEMRLVTENRTDLQIDAFKIDGEGFAAQTATGPFGLSSPMPILKTDQNPEREAERVALADARDILSKWSVEKLQDKASKEFLKATSKDELQKQFDELKGSLGEFRSFEGKISGVEPKSDSIGPYEEGIVNGKAEFAKGTATVKIQMIRRNRTNWEILNFVVKPQKPG